MYATRFLSQFTDTQQKQYFNKVQKLPKMCELSSVQHESEADSEVIQPFNPVQSKRLIIDEKLKDSQSNLCSSIAMSEVNSSSHDSSGDTIDNGNGSNHSPSLSPMARQPPPPVKPNINDDMSEYTVSQVNDSNVMFSSELMNEYSMVNKRRTRKQILQDMSYETQCYNIYDPEYSSQSDMNDYQLNDQK